jgi:hypothetical protein
MISLSNSAAQSEVCLRVVFINTPTKVWKRTFNIYVPVTLLYQCTTLSELEMVIFPVYSACNNTFIFLTTQIVHITHRLVMCNDLGKWFLKVSQSGLC